MKPIVRFWGTRGSVPAPGNKTKKYGGNTSCVEVAVGSKLFILDAGTGIRELGVDLMKRHKGAPIDGSIFITHTHWDHIQGFPFFIPAYIKGSNFRIHGTHGVGRTFEKVFRGLMDPSYFPVETRDMAASLEFIEVPGEPFDRDEAKITTIFTNHPGMNVAYRLDFDGGRITYLTDHETYQTMNEPTAFALKQDEDFVRFAQGSDLLIVDAQYTDEDYKTKKGWGHSRFKDSVALGIRAGVKKLALFHHDPYHDDAALDQIDKDARVAAKAGPKGLDCFMAKDGLEVKL